MLLSACANEIVQVRGNTCARVLTGAFSLPLRIPCCVDRAAVTRRGPVRSVDGPNAGRSTASIIAANRARNAARDRAAANRERVPF